MVSISLSELFKFYKTIKIFFLIQYHLKRINAPTGKAKLATSVHFLNLSLTRDSLVETRRVELLSENKFTKTSPGAVCD